MKPSSAVQAFDPLCEVQSDKASVEITSPFEGTVKDILVKEGQIAKVGEDLCTIEVDGEVAEEIGVHEDIPPTSSSTASTHLLSTAESASHKEETASTKRKSHPLDPQRSKTEVSEVKSSSSDALALPSVRHFAKANGVDISRLAPGSGRNGRVERVDVEEYLVRSSVGTSSKASLETPAKEDVVVELGRTRHNMWKAMVKVRKYAFWVPDEVNTIFRRVWRYLISVTRPI